MLTRDLTRYAIRQIRTGEVLAVGLRKSEADIYVVTFNRIRTNQEDQVEKVEIEWKVRAPHPIS